MTDIQKELAAHLARFTDEFKALQAQREAQTSAEIRAAFDTKLTALEARIENVRSEAQKVERGALPGLEYARNGEEGKFSIARAAKLAIDLKEGDARAWDRKEYGVEVEAMREYAKRTSYNIGTSATGGVFVPNTVMMDSIIPDLRSLSVVERAGARSLSGLVGTFDWPVDQGGVTAYEIDTEAKEEATESSDTYKLISVRPHTVSANASLTRGMRMQSDVVVENLIRTKFARELALKQDEHALAGTGVGRIPTGVRVTTGINTTSWSSADFGPSLSGTNQNIDNLLRQMAYAPMLANYNTVGGSWKFVMQPQVGLKIASVQSTNDRVPVFATLGAAELTSLMGTEVLYTTNVNTTTYSSSARFMMYGDWTQLTIARWGVMEIKAGYVGNNLRSDVLTLAAFMEHDIVVTQPKAFVAATSLTAA
jgi:HK97 family phage major capsid protein